MNTLNFDNGYKEFCINGNQNAVIRICTTDFSLPAKFHEMHEQVAQLIKNIGTSPDMDLIAEADKDIRAKVDALFGSPVSDTVFGTVNCLTLAGGTPLVVNFLEAVMPVIKEQFQAEMQSAKERTEKYTAQIADIPQA